jgi:opacity protein-like surface antigen
MNRLFVAVVLCFVFCIPMYARDYPKAEIYGGYQLIVDDELVEDITYSGTSVFDGYERLHGFNAALEYNIKSWLGVVGEFSHGRTSPSLGNITEFAPYPQFSTEYRRNQTSFLFGPRFSYRNGRFRVFGHALLGGNRVSRGSTHISLYEDGSKNVYDYGQSYTDLATAFGGGLDISLGKFISIRPAQLDLFSTYRSYDTHHKEYNQYQLRYSAGVVFKIGSLKR